MRLYLETNVVRGMARRLKRAAQASGTDMKLTYAQNQIAWLFGYRNYISMKTAQDNGTVSQLATLMTDDFRRAAVNRLAADNGWTVELAERLFESVQSAKARATPERPALIVELKRPRRIRGSAQPRARIFDLRDTRRGEDHETY